MNIEDAIILMSDKVGGDNNFKVSREASLDAIEKTFDIIPNNVLDVEPGDPNIQRLFFHLTDPKKLEYIEEFTKDVASSLDDIVKKEDPSAGSKKIESNNKEYANSFSAAALLLARLEKLYTVYSKGIEQIESDKDKHLISSLRNMGIILNLEPVLGKGKVGTIGKIGGLDSDIEEDKFEVIVKREPTLLPKKDIHKILKGLPANSGLKVRSKGNHLKKMQDIKKTSSESIKGWYEWASKTLEKTVDNIEEQDDVDSVVKIENVRDFSDRVGGDIVLNLVINHKGKETSIGSKIKEKESKSTSSKTLKDKRRLLARIRQVLGVAELPAFDDNQIQRQGDYFRLFNTLRSENSSWMDTILLNDVFKGEANKFNEFKQFIEIESPEEAEQLNYLTASELWILKFIESDYLGEFSSREIKQHTSTIQSMALDKSKDIKNSYLSKGFNLGNFNSVQINPEISLPLYKKVRLAVTKEDRKKENPFRNIASGIGGALLGLVSTKLDNFDAGRAKRNNDQNKAVFQGISQVVKGIVGAAGGKDAARKYEKGMKKATDNRLLKGVGLTTADRESNSVKEDMVAPMDGAPGGFHQTGPSMAGGFTQPDGTPDPFALVGPSKNITTNKKKKKKKKKSNRNDWKDSRSFASSKVLSFSDFINRES